jgi:hypothetical protein
MRNLFAEFKALLAPGVLQVGNVTLYADGIATIQLPGGGTLRARGEANIGDRVFVRDGVIEGPAAELPIVIGEV